MLRVIDIETTGTDPATDKICEIASADLSQTAVTTCRSHVVNPGVTMPPQASAVAPIHTRFDARPGPVPDDARGYAEARCFECLANPGGFDGPTGAE